MIPWLGFTPDLDPMTPGAIVDCENIVPTKNGIAGAPTPYDVGLPELAADAQGAAVTVRLDGVRRGFVGTAAALYEAGSSSYSDVSKAGGYTGGSESAWHFAQFGNISLATNGADKIQFSESGAFADIAGAPKAKIIVTASGFVLAFNLVDHAQAGALPNGWACSHLYDYTDWTPDTSNQSEWGPLLDTPGEVRAAHRLRQDVVAYKERSMYLGRYVGAPIVWAFELVSSEVGAVSQGAVVDTGTAHLFLGRDDFWVFDGSTPLPLDTPIKEWFFKKLDQQYAHRVRGHYNRFTKCAWWWFPTSDSAGDLNAAVVFNTETKRWGYVKQSAHCVFDYQAASMTWGEWPGNYTFAEIPDLPFDSPAWDFSSPQFAIVGTDKKIKTLAGACASAYIITGTFGDDSIYSTLTEVVPRFKQRPATSTLTHYTAEYSGGDVTQRGQSNLNGSKYDCLFSDRLHKLKFEFTGDFEQTGFNPKLVADE